MIWTIVLVTTGIAGTWLAAKHWWGWLIGVVNEVQWAAYAVTIHSMPLLIMAFVWAFVNVRNVIVTRKRQR